MALNEKTIISINSTIVYVIAFLLTTIIHELAHAISGFYLGSSPVLHHNFVEHLTSQNQPTNHLVIEAMAGPLISLLQGIIAGFVFIKIKNGGIVRLFTLWFSVLGLVNFFGYLMTGPIFQKGDIGKVFKLLELNLPTQILIAVFGAVILVFVAYKLTIPFLGFSYDQKSLSTQVERERFSFKIIILPWLAGSVAITFLYLPVIAVVSIIYPFTSGMIFIFPWKNARRVENLKPALNTEIGKFSFTLTAVLIVLILVFKLALEPGIAF